MAALRRGPKPPVDDSPLPFDLTGDDVSDFTRFCETYIRVEGGAAMVLRPWQIDIIDMLWGDPKPKLCALSIGRGNSKSTAAAAICLFRLFLIDDFSIDLIAFDERQSGIIGGIATKMVARHPELAKRAQIFKDHITVRGSDLFWLPATASALEGRLPDFVVCDEGGRIDREVFEVCAFSVTKKGHAQLLLIGTPGPNPENVLAQFRDHCLSHPEDTSQQYMEFSADQWRDHPVDCDDHGDGPGSGCLSAANPALGDWLSLDSVLSTLPPKMTEQHWRRVRLVQFWATGSDEPFIPRDVWENLGTAEPIPVGSRVVIAVDGAFSGARSDTFALLLGTVSAKPVFEKLRVWESDGTPEWRIDLLEVEDAIRAAARKYNVVEVCVDPFRLNRSMQILQNDGLTVSEFPWNATSRVTQATTDAFTAAVNGNFSYVPDKTFTEHVMNATVVETQAGGLKVDKSSRRKSAGHLDLCACLVMCFSRCVWLGTRPRKRARIVGA